MLTTLVQNELPRPVSSWEEHCDVVQDITAYMAVVINNLVAFYFAFWTVPRDPRVQAKLTKKDTCRCKDAYSDEYHIY